MFQIQESRILYDVGSARCTASFAFLCTDPEVCVHGAGRDTNKHPRALMLSVFLLVFACTDAGIPHASAVHAHANPASVQFNRNLLSCCGVAATRRTPFTSSVIPQLFVLLLARAVVVQLSAGLRHY